MYGIFSQHSGDFVRANVGKDSSTMEHMGYVILSYPSDPLTKVELMILATDGNGPYV